MVVNLGVKSIDGQFRGLLGVVSHVLYEKLNFLYRCIHSMYMSTSLFLDLDECTIHFTSHEEQAKAFNYLIHSKIGFKGIDRDTIRLKQSACDELDIKNIQYEITY